MRAASVDFTVSPVNCRRMVMHGRVTIAGQSTASRSRNRVLHCHSRTRAASAATQSRRDLTAARMRAAAGLLSFADPALDRARRASSRRFGIRHA